MNHTYKPYTGGAGPTAQQKESNTLYLGELLTEMGKTKLGWRRT
jgi:hypothetical protein